VATGIPTKILLSCGGRPSPEHGRPGRIGTDPRIQNDRHNRVRPGQAVDLAVMLSMLEAAISRHSRALSAAGSSTMPTLFGLAGLRGASVTADGLSPRIGLPCACPQTTAPYT
jgi:hypothetical protein